MSRSGGGGWLGGTLACKARRTGRASHCDRSGHKPASKASPSNLQVRRHDLVRDRLHEREFDLVHTRLVLMHLPQREQVLKFVRCREARRLDCVGEFDSLSQAAGVLDPISRNAAKDCCCVSTAYGIPGSRSAERCNRLDDAGYLVLVGEAVWLPSGNPRSLPGI